MTGPKVNIYAIGVHPGFEGQRPMRCRQVIDVNIIQSPKSEQMSGAIHGHPDYFKPIGETAQ